MYTFAPHPSLPEHLRVQCRFHVEDLFEYWEFAPDGEAVRAKELAELLTQMNETKDQMLQSPPDAIPAALLAHDPSAEMGARDQALVTTDQLRALVMRGEQMKEDAEKRSAWISTHSKQLGQQGSALANFHQERAEVALARVNAQLDGVKAILKSVSNLRLYLGEGVDLMVLREGAPAALDAPVTLYQDLLSFDEECLINLAAGGLDHTDTKALIDALSDEALLNRLIPAERGVVLVRFRATFKEFIKVKDGATTHDNVAIHRYNTQMSEESMRKRLLVRDGERLWLIDADDVLKPIDQLMPSSGEQAGYFTRSNWDRDKAPRQVTRDDLDYAKSQRAQLGALDHYAQVLIVLWGLRDAQRLFENTRIPRYASWLDPIFQNTFLRLVSHDTLLAVERPGFAMWQSEHNAYFVAGAWVAVDLSQAFTHERAAAAYTATGSAHYKPSAPQRVLIDRVRSDTEGLYVQVPCDYCGYGDVRRQSMNVKLYLKRHRAGVHSALTEGVLTLDRINAPDLSYYLQSRRQRRGYQRYLLLFQQALTWTATRDAIEAPLREQLRDDIRAGAISHDPETLDARITDALAIARTARHDQTMPQRGTAAFKRYLEAARNALHASLTSNSGNIAAIDAWAKAAGREPLRLVRTGKNLWKLYLTPTESEHDPRMGAPVHAAWADVHFDTDGCAHVTVHGRALLRAMASEQVVHDWSQEVASQDTGYRAFREDKPRTRFVGAPEWLAKAPPYRASYADAIATLDLSRTQSAAFAAHVDLSALVAACVRYMRQASKRYVRCMPLGVAIGSALHQERPMLLIEMTDALEYAFHAGDEAIKEACRAAVRSVYREKDLQLRKLELSRPGWTPHYASIDAARPHLGDALSTRTSGVICTRRSVWVRTRKISSRTPR